MIDKIALTALLVAAICMLLTQLLPDEGTPIGLKTLVVVGLFGSIGTLILVTLWKIWA